MNSPANLRRIKQHCAGGLPGCVTYFKNHKTGATIATFCNEQAGIEPAMMWTVRCETHGASELCVSYSDAKRLQTDPGGWCPSCLEAQEVKERHG